MTVILLLYIYITTLLDAHVQVKISSQQAAKLPQDQRVTTTKAATVTN